MKKTSIYLSLALAMGLWSCTSEDAPKTEVEGNDGDVYATLSFDFGSTRGTRSETVEPGDNPSQSDAGFEIGKDYENNVETVIVVLAQQNGTTGDYTYVYVTDSGICNATPISNTNTGAAGVNNPLYRIKFSNKDLEPYAGKNLQLFAYCNPTVSFVKAIENGTWNVDMQETISHPDNSYIWANGNFLMTSAEEHLITVPADIATTHYSINNPIDMGKVLVQRASARFDFAATTINVGTADVPQNLEENTYPIYEQIGDPESTIQGYVTLDGMALFNQAQNFYFLSRVASGTNSGPSNQISLLGKETKNNWVISPANKTFDYSIDGSLAEGATNPPANPESFKYTAISDILKNAEDNDDNWNKPAEFDSYHIWRYTTENTIPSVAGQVHGKSTGVLFRGHISAGENQKIAAAITSGNPLYTFQGVMYGSLADLREYVVKYPGSALSVAFQADFGVAFDESNSKEIISSIVSSAKDLEKSTKYFNVYKKNTTTGNYNVYYYYYNRHNDNGNNIVMVPMEFATVRNNVYKLKVNNIYQWGNPGDKPTDPDGPDEEPEVFIKVQFEVLPWVVRVNNIEF